MKQFLTPIILCAGLGFAWQAHAGHNAQYVSQSVMDSTAASANYTVSVTFKNTGTTTWTAGLFRLGEPANTWNWHTTRVDLNPGETVQPGETRTFTFPVNGPYTTASKLQPFNFQWQMLKEGETWFGDKSPNVVVYSVAAPDIRTNYPPLLPPTPVVASDFDFDHFRGANVLESATTRPDGVLGWIPTEAQMTTIAQSAQIMNLNVLRMAVAIPLNGSNTDALYTAVKQDLDIAMSYGLRMILAIGGYDKYNGACNWEEAYIKVDQSAASFIRAMYAHPAVMAWDLNNEPLWFASAQDCLTNLSDYQNVVDGVHAMYNLVRANDPSGKPTTVGDSPLPFMHYWTDIESFASPHLYQTNMPQMAYTTEGTMRLAKAESGSLPMIIGEFGYHIPSHVPNEGAQAAAYRVYFDELKRQNVGSAFWSLSLSEDQHPMSLINSDGSLRPAAHVVKSYHDIARNAHYVSQNVPTVMKAGASYNVSITFDNTGNNNWALANYKLGTLNTNFNLWGPGRIALNSAPAEFIKPGQRKQFNFTVTAPAQAGTYDFQWQMLQDNVTFFGDTTPKLTITVQ
ncbi:NBR1-Ig-like domain-containing protein [Duganella sp. HH105]|uniref:NBR1-Ig-like domain-containing protein n=1 Tax=Duganella sp. HH105 TaxID=1781067 RepID=UPI000893D5BA|nr:NBR1-Ig-like domain-containing protein [Duganella sp. HH105]OEZ60936.1 NPCBM-associated, NEW3 domain of alpha-galactosidase [Duganella sp. HH105]